MDDPVPPPLPTEPPPIVVEARPVGLATSPDVSVASPYFTLREPPALSLPGVDVSAAWLDLALVLIVAVIARYVPEIIVWSWSGRAELPGDLSVVLTLGKWFEMSAAVMLLIYMCARNAIAPRGFGVRADRLPAQFGWSAATLVGCYACFLGVGLMIGLAAMLFPQAERDLMQRVEFSKAMPTQDLSITLLLLIPVAIHEEVIFRGLLIPYFWRVSGSATLAVLVTALIFGALHIHQGVLGMIQITALGAALGAFFVWSRSLLATALAHFAFNFLQFQLINSLRDLLEKVR